MVALLGSAWWIGVRKHRRATKRKQAIFIVFNIKIRTWKVLGAHPETRNKKKHHCTAAQSLNLQKNIRLHQLNTHFFIILRKRSEIQFVFKFNEITHVPFSLAQIVPEISLYFFGGTKCKCALHVTH